MMEGLIGELAALASNPYAWIVVGGLALVAMHSLVSYLRCPLVHGTGDISPELARAAVDAERVHSTRYLVLMLLGIGLAVAGTAMVALSARPPVALGMIAAGLFLTQTEPLRLNIHGHQLRVVAARIEDDTACETAIGRLRGEYQRLVVTNTLLAAAVAIYLLAF